MLETLPMAGFIQGNITDGPCGVSVSNGGMSFERLSEKGRETAFRAQGLDLATGKNEHVDLDPIGIYKLKIGLRSYRHRVTNEIIEEKTLLSPDFGEEAIGVWTSSGDTGQGTKEEYERVIDRARIFANTLGEAAMFWISPGEAGATGKPEHRAYLWKKDGNDEVTAHAYQLSGSRESIGLMMNKLGFPQSQEPIENRVILTADSSIINSARIFQSYAGSLTPEEKEGQSSFLAKFQQDMHISDSQRLEKLESQQKQYENELKAAYQGDIQSALKSVLHGMFSLASNSKTDYPMKTGEKVNRINNGDRLDGVSPGKEDSLQAEKKRTELLPKGKRQEQAIVEQTEENSGLREKTRELAQDKLLRLEIIRKILTYTVSGSESAQSDPIIRTDADAVAAAINHILDQTQNRSTVLIGNGEPIAVKTAAEIFPVQKEETFSGNGNEPSVASRQAAVEKPATGAGDGQLLMIISREIAHLKAQDSKPPGKPSGRIIGVIGGQQTLLEGAGKKRGDGLSENKTGREISEIDKSVFPHESILPGENKVTAVLSLIQLLTEKRISGGQDSPGGGNAVITGSDTELIYNLMKVTVRGAEEGEKTKQEKIFSGPIGRRLKDPSYLLELYEGQKSTDLKILITVLMHNWLTDFYRGKETGTVSRRREILFPLQDYSLKAALTVSEPAVRFTKQGPKILQGAVPSPGDLKLLKPSAGIASILPDLRNGEAGFGGLKWDIKKIEIRKVLDRLTEVVKNGKRHLSPVEKEILAEIILLLRLLTGDRNLLQDDDISNSQSDVMKQSDDVMEWEMMPAAIGFNALGSFYPGTMPKKLKRIGLIYHYLGPLFVTCNTGVKYDKI